MIIIPYIYTSNIKIINRIEIIKLYILMQLLNYVDKKLDPVIGIARNFTLP